MDHYQGRSIPNRREMLSRASMGFGAAALADLLQSQSTRANDGSIEAKESTPKGTHHPPKAKHVIFCYMSGGVSAIDSFDPKPRLTRDHGKPMPVKIERTMFNNNGNIMGSPFPFTPAGDCGMPISSLFPYVAKVADELAVVRSMTAPFNEHAQANFFMHTGFPIMGYPSAGAWASYGLGNDNEDLPAYVVLQSGTATAPHGGVSLFSNGFLPAHHQGSLVKADQSEAIRNIRPSEPLVAQRKRLSFVGEFDQTFSQTASDPQVDAAIQNFETAFRMQTSVPLLCDLADEKQETLSMYGVDSPDAEKSAYAKQCLMARRLVERGVRFIELSCLTRGIGAGNAPNPWDQHNELERGHAAMALQVDQPIWALIHDLKQRGLLAETLVVWAGEFGRTPFSQGTLGRDHNPYGFSIWMAGGGTKGGSILGATDELGYYAIEDKCTVYDMWATVLHLLGIDHERLTYRYSGRDFRLTDVHGNVLKKILA
jgi:hypothetical protein